MENIEPKKLLILRILEILTEYSDAEHRLHQNDVINLLRIVYGIECERKAVARNVEYLVQAGYDIVNDKTGMYLAGKKFETGELRLLIDSVLANRNISKRYTKELIDKLASEGGKYFKNYAKHVVNLDDWRKNDGLDYFYNIELLCEAIKTKRQAEFFYDSYDIDLQKHHRSAEKYCASCYQLLLKNGFYYAAVCFVNHDNLAFVRVDRLSDIVLTSQIARPFDSVHGGERGLNIGQLVNTLPYLYSDEPQHIEFVTANGIQHMTDYVVDWFGRDVQVTELPDGNLKFSLTAGPWAMKFWLMQFGKRVKVLSPQSLVDDVKAEIGQMAKLYK